MKCTECKFQWCWLCEKEYLYGHFESGLCNGLQFEKINYLSEKNQYKLNRNSEGQTGCCLCVSSIESKFDFWTIAGPYGYYHGN